MATAPRQRGPDAGELARMLAGQAAQLAAELLPQGRRDGVEWRCGSLGGERGRSLAVRISGGKAGVWSDFASGESGDALDLVAAALFAGDKAAAIGWARRWLGLGEGTQAATQRRAAPPAAPQGPSAAELEDEAERRRAALRIFLAAEQTIAGTPAALYLAARGIDLAELGRQPRALRFHAGLWNRESGRKWPALVAAVTDAAGEHVATHRTWLAERDGRWTKAPLKDPKMSIGTLAGGTIRLWRGATGKALRHAGPGETVAIAEGIETALSVAVLCPRLRVLCGVSLSNMGRIELPANVGTVLLCADNDGDNQAAARGLQRVIDHFAAASGRLVKIARSPIGKDFNDALTSGDPAA